MENKKAEIKQYILDNIGCWEGMQAEELHGNLFNKDYYIIWTDDAKKWLGQDVFECMELVKEFEEFQTGQVITNFVNTEQLTNTTAYILGEKILYDTEIEFEGELTETMINAIKEKLS